MRNPNGHAALPVRAVIVIAFMTMAASFGAISLTFARDIQYLAPAGAPANAFPKPERPVAQIVSPHRSTEKERDAIDESGQIVRLMGLRAGMTIADIGAGSGYHTIRLSRVVGQAGSIVAQDVTPDYLTQLSRRVKSLNLQNVRVSLGEPHDPRLPPASLDAAILVHMYHEIAQPYALLYNLAPALRPGASVGIVDLDQPTPNHGTPSELLRCELAAVGYRQTGFHKLTGDVGYLAIFSPPAGADRKPPASIVFCKG